MTIPIFSNIIDELHQEYPGTPVPIVDIAVSRNIKIQYVTQLGINTAGSIEKKQDGEYKYLIQVNALDNYRGQRFTIAHELGHYFLHREEIDKKKKGLVDNKVYRSGIPYATEIEANKFAAHLLMPIDRISAIIDNAEQPVALSYLADMFAVSKVAMSTQLGVPIEK